MRKRREIDPTLALLRQCVDEMEQEEVGSASAAIVGHLVLWLERESPRSDSLSVASWLFGLGALSALAALGGNLAPDTGA